MKNQYMLDKLKGQGGKAKADDIAYLITQHKEKSLEMVNNYNWYLSKTTATNPYDPTTDGDGNIFSRTRPKAFLENVKVHNDFISKIVDQLIGYMGDVQFSSEDDTLRKIVDDFTLKNSFDDIINEIIKYMTVCGYASIQLYRDPDSTEYGIAVIDPWKVIFLENSVNKVIYALKYEEIQKDANNKAYLVEFYGPNSKQIFESSYLENGYSEIPSAIEGDRLNIFAPSVPLVQFKNNAEEISDIQIVIPLQIDYDRTLSDEANDLRQHARALIKSFGFEFTDATVKAIKEYGAIHIPDKTTGDITYLVKPSYENPIQQHLNNVQKAIHTTAKDIDMTDEQFGGNLSGVAIKFKLMALENKAYMKEKKINVGLRAMWKALFGSMKIVSGVNYNYLGVQAEFNRNLPVNMVEQVQILRDLLQTVDTMTALEMSKIIKDPQKVFDRIQEQKTDEFLMYSEIPEGELEGEGEEGTQTQNNQE